VWTVRAEPYESPISTALIRAYMRELVDRYHGKPMPEEQVDYAVEYEQVDTPEAFFVAFFDGTPAGCAGLVHGELTRMFVLHEFRRRGAGRLLLTAVENEARSRGLESLRIDTRKDLFEAHALYEIAGYIAVPAFSEGPYSDRWYEKPLTEPT
jgi:GNAT superfamily N-acetyltransferase